MVGKWQRVGISFLILHLGGGAVGVDAQGEKSANPQLPLEPVIQRVVVLLPPHASPATPQVQWRIDQERASRSKSRAKSRRRSQGAKAVAASAVPTPTPKSESRTSLPDASVAPHAANGSSRIFGPLNTAAPAVGKIDVVPAEQRVTLAQALLADALVERLQDRLGLVVVSENEATQALQELHLTPEQALQPDNARRLCARLNCQAILMPRVTSCAIWETATRDVSVFADIRLAGISDSDTKPLKPTTSGRPGALEPKDTKRGQIPLFPARQSTPTTENVPVLARWPARISVAGTAIADRVLFHKQYQKPQGDLIRDAAQQATTLLLHALRLGEQSPFMRPDDRVAVTPLLTPRDADKLIFTSVGRRVVPAALANLHADVSTLFLPDLLPIAPDRIAGEEAVRAALNAQGIGESALWVDEDRPALARVQALGRSLHTQYVLLTRVTDVELSESGPNTGLSVNADTPTAERGRSVRVEATAALTRVTDGALLWHDRAIATMTASPQSAASSRQSQTNENLARDATHFALVELQRRLRKYRSTFEK